jgi:fatty-acyl-CoA synthase
MFSKGDTASTAGPALEQEIIETTKAHLAKFKVPKRMIFGPLPRNGAGKIQKFMLRDMSKEDAAKQPKSKL